MAASDDTNDLYNSLDALLGNQTLSTLLKTDPLQSSFSKLKSNLELNESFDDLIQQKHSAVRSVIENKGANFETKLIGSLQRKTRIQPGPNDSFDIDILVILGEFYDWVPAHLGISPQQALQTVHETINQSSRYSAMSPRQDAPTITFEYQDNVKVELVPAYLDKIGHSSDGRAHVPIGRAYWVPKNGRWELADYDYEADYISTQNSLTDGWLVPIIKMLKSIKRQYTPDLSSHHLEILASHVIPKAVLTRKQQGKVINYPSLITDFFLEAEDYLYSPTRMYGSNSPVIELDLINQAHIPQKVEEIKNYCNSISGLSTNDQIEAWKKLFGDPFPAS